MLGVLKVIGAVQEADTCLFKVFDVSRVLGVLKVISVVQEADTCLFKAFGVFKVCSERRLAKCLPKVMHVLHEVVGVKPWLF